MHKYTWYRRSLCTKYDRLCVDKNKYAEVGDWGERMTEWKTVWIFDCFIYNWLIGSCIKRKMIWWTKNNQGKVQDQEVS